MQKLSSLSAIVLFYLLTTQPTLAQNTVLTTTTTMLPGGGTGSENVVVGPGNSYPSANNTRFNTFIGLGSGTSTTTGYANSFVGYLAGYNNTSGNFNSFMGTDAGYSNTSGYNNTFMGLQAGFDNNSGINNSFMGLQAGFDNNSGINNSFIGYQAGMYNTTGGSNLFTGSSAGYSNTVGYGNSFMGFQAGYGNTSGYNNLFTGFRSGYENTTGSLNSFTGTSAGYNNSTGSYNSFVGSSAGVSNTTGSYNSFLGFEAGHDNTVGLFNTFSGYQAGFYNIIGSYNTFMGCSTDAIGTNRANLQRATALGYNSKVAVNDGLVLGDTSNVKVGIGTAYPNQRLTLRGNMNFVAHDNSLRLKNQPFLHFNEHESLALGLGAEIPDGAEKTLVLGSDQTHVQIPGLLNTRLTNAGQFLTIDELGKMTLTQPRVQVASVAEWSDEVFEEGYSLRPLREVEEFVKKNKHLPGVPSAAAMVAEGMEATAFNAKLLEKIGELTLYVLKLEKRDESRQQQIDSQQQQADELRTLFLSLKEAYSNK